MVGVIYYIDMHIARALQHLLRFSRNRLEALAVNDTRAGLVVLLLRAPEVLEGRQRRENRSTDPDGVLPLGRSNDLDLIAVRHADQQSMHISI